MNIFELPRDEFLAMLPELRQQGVDTDALLRQYRSANSPFAGINEAATASQAALADEGRRSVAGGLLSKPEGATGMDAVRGLDTNFIGGLLNMLSGGGQAIDAPMAAAQGLIPQGDMSLEALGTAGLAMTGGGAATVPRGSLRMGMAREAAGTDGEQMARRILEMRAAGRASEVTDDMMAQADPQVMFNETPLDMSVGARMQRAEDMGADPLTQFYHGTAKGGFVDTTDIQAFDPSRVGDRWNADDRGFSITSSPQDANYYAKPSDPGYGPDGIKNDNLRDGMIYPLEDLSSRPYNIRPMDDFEGTIGAWDNRPDNTYDLMDAAGADSARIYSDGVEMRVVMDPKNLRSRFARFDPEFAHLSNLSAANMSPTGGLLATSAQGEQKQDLPFMAVLKGLLQ